MEILLILTTVVILYISEKENRKLFQIGGNVALNLFGFLLFGSLIGVGGYFLMKDDSSPTPTPTPSATPIHTTTTTTTTTNGTNTDDTNTENCTSFTCGGTDVLKDNPSEITCPTTGCDSETCCAPSIADTLDQLAASCPTVPVDESNCPQVVNSETITSAEGCARHDVNFDNAVNIEDTQLILMNMGYSGNNCKDCQMGPLTSSCDVYDVTGDGTVNVHDNMRMSGHFGCNVCP
jgi:hypothetical protein